MRKIIGILLLLLFISVATSSFAGVQFIVDSKSHTQRDTYKKTHTTTVQTCPNRGYNKTSCPTGERGIEFCPTSLNYFKYCCPAEYKYTLSQCKEMQIKPIGSSCHGYYKCE